MKKSIYFLMFLLGVSTVISCSKFLESAPLSNTTVESFYRNAKEAEIGLTGVYNMINVDNGRTFRRNLCIMLNGAADEVIWDQRSTNADMSPWGNGSFSSQSNFINLSWISLYAGINRANILIERIQNIDDFAGNRKAEMEGEARFLRGMYHMVLAMMHGGIPVYTTAEQDPTLARQSIDKVYAQIIEDYLFAYNNLPHRAGITGRANKWTAAGYLAKVYTYLAAAKVSGTSSFGLEINSFDWVNSSDYYDKAKSLTKTIIDNSGYILIPNYGYLFRETTRKYQYQETLLASEGNNDLGLRAVNHLVNLFVPYGSSANNGGGNPQMRPLSEHVDKYSRIMDVRFKNNVTDMIPSTNPPVEVIEGARYYIPNAFINYNSSNTSPGKFRMIDPKTKIIGTSYSGGNVPLLRLADIYLLYAEALYFTGDEPAARNVLTEVRRRAVNDPANLTALNTAYYKTNFVDELLDERSRELCYENWRRFDLCRFNKYDQKIQALGTTGFFNTTVPNLKQNWKPEKIWFPIPQVQRDLNSNLVQNKGY